MNPQRELFDPAATTSQTCPVGHCQALRLAGQTGRIISCAHDLDPESRRRPSGCLNEYRPDLAEIPF